jgi:STE24 endopeptidase
VEDIRRAVDAPSVDSIAITGGFNASAAVYSIRWRLQRCRTLVLGLPVLTTLSTGELRAVIAHELAHRKYRDVVNFTAIGVAAAIVLVFVLWAVLGREARDPRSIPLALLVLTLAQPLLLVLVAAISRRWEYRADTFALRLTRDLAALERTFRRLADSNVADLEPPRVVYWLRHTHPTVPERIAALRETARVEGLQAEEAA